MNILGYYIDKDFIIRNRDFLFPSLFIVLYVISFVSGFSTAVNVLGCLMIIYVPGTAFIRMLFPKEGDIDIFERTVLSVGMSVILVSLFGFIMINFIGLTLEISLIVVLGLSVAFLAVAYYRVFR